MEKKQATSVRLTVEAKRLLQLLSEKLGLTHTSIIELAIREKARREGIR